MEFKDFLEFLKKHAEEIKKEIGKEVKINEKIAELVFKNNLMCICKINKKCPCEEHVNEIKEKGRCYCGLFFVQS